MTSLNSSLYTGTVRHHRLEPFRHGFEYRVFYGLFDIDELDVLDRDLKFFSVGRFNLFGLNPADHGPADGGPLRPWAEHLWAQAGVDLEGGSVRLLAYPRVLGYVFNPISVWYGYGPDGELRGVLYEVRNTFGHKHVYVVSVSREGLEHRTLKKLHVSPFNDMEETYDFTLTLPAEWLGLVIDHSSGEGRKLRAAVALSRAPLTDTSLLRVFVTHPLLTLKVIGGIHWQALKLWIKGARYRSVPEPPASDYTIIGQERISL